jgi:hypothetical protein
LRTGNNNFNSFYNPEFPTTLTSNKQQPTKTTTTTTTLLYLMEFEGDYEEYGNEDGDEIYVHPQGERKAA